MLALNHIYLEDCLTGMVKLPPRSVDLILCDLPYGTTRNPWDVVIPLEPLWACYERVLADAGVIVLTSAEPFTSVLVTSNLAMFRYDIIWEKTNPTGFFNAKKMPMRAHENVLVFYKKPGTYNPQKTSGHPRKVSSASHRRGCKLSSNYGNSVASTYDSTERYPRSVLQFASDKQTSKLHPTQKPVALFEWLIRTYTNPGDTVLDNCMGSGTTAIACMNTDRNFIGFETDPVYHEKSLQRIAEHPNYFLL
jgi:site-specific DNA-methyltransferase (adenine-specific)